MREPAQRDVRPAGSNYYGARHDPVPWQGPLPPLNWRMELRLKVSEARRARLTRSGLRTETVLRVNVHLRGAEELRRLEAAADRADAQAEAERRRRAHEAYLRRRERETRRLLAEIVAKRNGNENGSSRG